MEKAGRGLAVAGSGLDALKHVRKALLENEKAELSGEVSLFFYSLPLPYYVRLDQVERKGNEFVIRYHFVTHATKNMTIHFALIPLGKLSPGKFRVKLTQLPVKQGRLASPKPIDPKVVERFVCRSFSFEVGAKP